MEDQNDIISEFKKALQAINEVRPHGGGLSPQQEQLNQMRMEAAQGLSQTQPIQPMTGREEFASVLQGLSKGIQSSPARGADNYGGLLSGIGAGLIQGSADIGTQNRSRSEQNLANQQKNAQILNTMNLDQPTQDIGNAANMANTTVAARQRAEQLKSNERIKMGKLANDLAKAKGEKNVGLESVLKLKDRYDKATESFNKTRNFKSIVDAAKDDPTGMKAIGGVYAFLKAIDDGSVVRPSELDLATGSVSTLTSLGNQLKKTYEDGRPVAPEVVKQVADAMDVYFQAAQKNQTKINKDYSDLSTRYGVPAQDVVTADVGQVQGDQGKEARYQLYLQEKARRSGQ